MHKAAALLIALAIVSGCRKKTDAPTASGTASSGTGSAPGSAVEPAGSGSAPGSAAEPAGSGSSAAAGSGSADAPEASKPFPRFDDALKSGKGWITDEEAKAGIVELIAEDDLSGKTKGKFTTKRLCGDAAKKSAEAMGAAFVKRSKTDTHDPAICRDDEGGVVCFSAGVGEGDVGFEMSYMDGKLVGVKSYGMGVTVEKQEVEYKKLLGEKCK
jgi:hypothetical protein